ncbi:MAG: hypothetical protein HYV77_01795 [Candidatus Wildermuthbacteria bacterium]|nr:hypothetical protein [Candidatus Wildermuthbacteria bacterium]
MHVPMDDIEEVWNASNKSWEGLEKTLQAKKDKAEGVEDTIVEYMLAKAAEKRKASETFPETFQELYKIMNEDADDDENSSIEEE